MRCVDQLPLTYLQCNIPYYSSEIDLHPIGADIIFQTNHIHDGNLSISSSNHGPLS